MTRKELRLEAAKYSPKQTTQEAYMDGFKAAMAYYVREFEPEPDKPKRVTSCDLLRGIQLYDSRQVPIRDSKDWRRWRVLCHHFYKTYGACFRVQLEKTLRESIIITRIL